VFLYHVGTEEITGVLIFTNESFKKTLRFQGLCSHYVVIIFFVLSGFLITMSVSKPGLTLKNFYISRLGRLYSVLLPALITTFIIYFLLIFINIYKSEEIINSGFLPIRFVMNLFFLSQSFDFFAVPPINAPFWSISYEFMYYVLISSFFLIKGNKKYFIILSFAFVAGLKVLLLFPCWLLGSFLFYTLKNKIYLNKIVSMLLFLMTSFLITMIIIGFIEMPYEKVPSSTNSYLGIRLFQSNNYLADTIFALLFTINMFSVFSFSNSYKGETPSVFFKFINNTISTLANCSFTLYLFHIPLLFLYSSNSFYDKNNMFHVGILISLVLLSVYFIAKKTEWQVLYWRNLVEKVVNFKFKNKLI